MKEIIELNQRIVALGVVPKEEGFVMVRTKGDLPVKLQAWPLLIRVELDGLRKRLNTVIPTDFEGLLVLGDTEPGLTLEYNDGAQTTANCPIPWDLTRSIFEQFEEIDWPSKRAEVIEECQTFDKMKEAAKHAAPKLPSTKQLQKEFREDMREFVKLKRTDLSKVHVLMFGEQDDEKPENCLTEAAFESVESFGSALIDIMPHQVWIITVVANGKPLPVGKIDELKQSALGELQKHMPISYYKALGTFGAGVAG